MNEVINFSNEAKKPFNLWIIVSAVLLISVLALVLFPDKLSITGNTINSNDAGTKAIDFINDYLTGGAGNATLSSVRDMGDMYEVNTSYNGKIIPTYITKDGKYFLQSALSIENPPAESTANTASQPVNVTKSEKPVVKAFVFSYCPYGLQFEKALSPVYTLLKDKADINLVYIGAMHGEHEKTESLRQLCIQKNYGTDMLWKYLDKFNADTAIGTCNSNTTCAKPLIDSIMTSLSIDSSKIDACITADAPALYAADTAAATAAGVTGSPTFTINGAKVQVARTPAAIGKAICDAFTTAPAECSQNLSSTAASAGFGASAASTGGTASC